MGAKPAQENFMTKKRPPIHQPPEIPVETEPTWAEMERVARRVLTTPPRQKGREKAPKQNPRPNGSGS